MVSAHARRGERLRAIGAQSRDRATITRNLGILRMHNAISNSQIARNIYMTPVSIVVLHLGEGVDLVLAS